MPSYPHKRYSVGGDFPCGLALNSTVVDIFCVVPLVASLHWPRTRCTMVADNGPTTVWKVVRVVSEEAV